MRKGRYEYGNRPHLLACDVTCLANNCFSVEVTEKVLQLMEVGGMGWVSYLLNCHRLSD